MSVLTYKNFNLLITRHQDSDYLARVIDSPAGEAKVPFALPCSAEQLESALALTLSSRSLSLPNEPPESTIKLSHQQIGSLLYENVFQKDVKDVLQKSLEIAKQNHQGLRLRLYLSEVPELINIPWEYLYDKSTDQFFALSIKTPVVRYLALENSNQAISIETPLNILVMISSPNNYSTLDVEKEWQQLQDSLSGLVQEGMVTITRLESATLEHLHTELHNKPYHIFHFMGHGDFEEISNDGVLILESATGSGEAISAKRIGTLLHDENTVQLAILNACEGSKTSVTNPFAGVAQSLVRQGIPAVIAMQYEVSDKTAILLSLELYRLLVAGYPVDTALGEVRKAIYSSSDTIEWGTPVLHLRSDNGEIMTTQAAKPETESLAKNHIPDPSPLVGTPFSLVCPSYFDDEVRITRHQLNKKSLHTLFQKWMKERNSQWPKSINAELLIKELKPVYLANFVVNAEGSANYRAQLGHGSKEKKTCPDCKGSGELIRPSKNKDEGKETRKCRRCKGTGSIEETTIKHWEKVMGAVKKSHQEDFRSYNQLDELESFRPGVKSADAANRFQLDHVSQEESTHNSILQTAVKGHQSFQPGVEQKLNKALFDSAKWKTKHKAEAVKDLELVDQQTRFKHSYTWLYPILLGTYMFKNEKLTVLVDDLAGKVAVQKPKALRKALLVKKLIITAAVIIIIGLGIYIYSVSKNT